MFNTEDFGFASKSVRMTSCVAENAREDRRGESPHGPQHRSYKVRLAQQSCPIALAGGVVIFPMSLTLYLLDVAHNHRELSARRPPGNTRPLLRHPHRRAGHREESHW